MSELIRTERAAWVDALRGLAILAVVFVHAGPGPGPDKYLHMVLVPAFFFASGLVFRADKYAGWQPFFRRRVQGLVIPYLFYSLLAWAFWTLDWLWTREILGRSGAALTSKLTEPLLGIPYGVAKHMSYNYPLWFLTCLFSADNLFYFLQKRAKSAPALAAALVGLSIAGYGVARLLTRSLPWHVDMAMIVLPYYGAGYLVRRRRGLSPVASPPIQALLAAAGLVFSIFCSRFSPETRWAGNNIGAWLPFHLTAIGAVIGFASLAQLLAPIRALGYFGRNSLPLLGLHTMTMAAFVYALVVARQIARPHSLHTTPWALLCAAAAILLALPCVPLLNRHAPWAVGRPRRAAPNV